MIKEIWGGSFLLNILFTRVFDVTLLWESITNIK